MARDSPRLFSYIVKYDTGAAPNPYGKYCTLVICKPRIRKAADIGDWIVGTGTADNPFDGKDYSNKVIYAMEITDKVDMEKYHEYCQRSNSQYGNELKNKIPKFESKDYTKQMGDCIYYNISNNYETAELRPGIHKKDCMERDLSGKYALISNHYYYFGDKAVEIKEDLKPIVAITQGHRSDANKNYVAEFIKWIESEEYDEFKKPKEPKPILEKHKGIFLKKDKSGSCESLCDRNEEYIVVEKNICIKE
ncbi:MAG: hypothetical protein JXA54_13450 [Candidatus Heimdallarchaeota archaeon]|nr:hypothetical protein [Candidatus Heimdallarchaeota archaeon]